jgi:excisionase family DNA binding protein
MGRRTVMRIETHELTVIRRLGPAVQAWCAACQARVEMLTPDQAAELAQVSSRTIYRWIETGKLHFTETPKGMLYVCRKSIPPHAPPASAAPKWPA